MNLNKHLTNPIFKIISEVAETSKLETYVVGGFVRDILLNRKLSYFGGENLFNNIYHVDDLANVIKKLINNGIKKKFDIINIGSNNPLKINQIVRFLNGKVILNSSIANKKNMFTINVDKLNKYYGLKLNTKYFLKKYLKEKKIKNKL